jgi:DNA polymerase III epsilon subunit-like protein
MGEMSQQGTNANQTLSQAVQQVLDDHPDGFTERAVRRAVIEEAGLRCTPREVRDTLRRHPDLFVPLAGGAWRSRAAVEAEQVTIGVEEIPRERGEVKRPYVAGLPPLDAFIAFDLETTGVKPERDRIIQVAAVRIVGGEPAAAAARDGTELPPVFDEYVDLEGREIPFGLKVKLGFTDHPEWEEELARAAPLAEVLERFRRWAGDLPLVAHNARFDLAFLERGAAGIGWQIANPLVDSMELACLAQAGTGSFRLEELARSLGVGEGLAGGRLVERWAHQHRVGAFSWTGFHNAVVDVLVLAAAVPRLVEAVRQRMAENPPLASEFARLMPHAAVHLGLDARPTGAAQDALFSSLVVRPSSVPDGVIAHAETDGVG